MTDLVNNLESRLSDNEARLIQIRLDALAADIKQFKSSRKILPRIKDIAAILTPLILAAVSFYVTHAITGAMEQERLQLDHLTAMQDLMVKLGSPETGPAEAEATAVSLAAFGPTAIVPLIHELQADGSVRPLAAEEGLRTVAFRYPESTCDLLIKVLENRSGLFYWQTHRSAIMLLGDIGCTEAPPLLEKLKTILASPDALEKYTQMVREDRPPNHKALNKIRAEIDRTSQKLNP